MASFEKVEQVLRTLALNFAGEVSAERVKLWYAALQDIPDAALDAGAVKVMRERTQDFLPPLAVIRSACQQRTYDGETILRLIDKAGSYNPQTGWQQPRIEKIREQFGDAVADAFGMAGGSSRLYADDPVTRDIAAREFGQALRDSPHEVLALANPTAPKRLTNPVADRPRGESS